jgi:hypothetical protein
LQTLVFSVASRTEEREANSHLSQRNSDGIITLAYESITTVQHFATSLHPPDQHVKAECVQGIPVTVAKVLLL